MIVVRYNAARIIDVPNMEINYWAVLGCAGASMAIGAVWYGPLFGRKWMEVNDLSPDDVSKREAMQKEAMPLSIVQFVLSLLQIFILSIILYVYYRYTNLIGSCIELGQCVERTTTYVFSSFLIWLGFIMPTVAGLAMWNMKPARVRWTLFGLSAGYQLICLLVFGFILGQWPV